MGSINISRFGRLTEAHIADCVALSSEAGWNQTIEDWALFPATRYGTWTFDRSRRHGRLPAPVSQS